VIAVFQPYLLKARQIYYDARQFADDAKNSAKNTFGKQAADSSNGVNGSGGYNTYNNGGYNTGGAGTGINAGNATVLPPPGPIQNSVS
jgi:hypothetical protein